MDNNKVTLPRDVAEAIESVRNSTGWTNELILQKVYTDGFEADWTVILNARYDVEKAFLIASALVNGYTIEQTPEEKVREYFDELTDPTKRRSNNDDYLTYCVGKKDGVKTTLDLLGIKIKGVNA